MFGRTATVGIVTVACALVIWLAIRDGRGSGAAPVAGPATATLERRRPVAPSSQPPASVSAPPAGNVHALVDACLEAKRQVMARRAARGGPAPAGEPSDSAVVAAACAPLFKDPSCREAQLHVDTPAAGSRTDAIEACKLAYCGKLTPPLPRACDPKLPPPEDGLETFTTWDELRKAILRRDIGDSEAARLDEEPAR